MTISNATSAYRSAPQAQKDNAAIGTAQRARNNTAEQRAVAALRRDAPTPSSERPEPRENDNDRDDSRVQAAQQQARTRESVGTALDVKA
jgi:hypothetical protein